MVDEELVAVEVRGGAAVAEGVDTLAVAGVAQPWGKTETDGEEGVRRAGLGVAGEVEVVTSAKGSGRPRLLRLKRCNRQHDV